MCKHKTASIISIDKLVCSTHLRYCRLVPPGQLVCLTQFLLWALKAIEIFLQSYWTEVILWLHEVHAQLQHASRRPCTSNAEHGADANSCGIRRAYVAVQIAHVAMYNVQSRKCQVISCWQLIQSCARTFFPSTQSHSCDTPTAAVLRPRGWVAAKKILWVWDDGMPAVTSCPVYIFQLLVLVEIDSPYSVCRLLIPFALWFFLFILTFRRRISMLFAAAFWLYAQTMVWSALEEEWKWNQWANGTMGCHLCLNQATVNRQTMGLFMEACLVCILHKRKPRCGVGELPALCFQKYMTSLMAAATHVAGQMPVLGNLKAALAGETRALDDEKGVCGVVFHIHSCCEICRTRNSCY